MCYFILGIGVLAKENHALSFLRRAYLSTNNNNNNNNNISSNKGATENAGVENAIQAKLQGWKMQE